jgi:hypothetical protein
MTSSCRVKLLLFLGHSIHFSSGDVVETDCALADIRDKKLLGCWIDIGRICLICTFEVQRTHHLIWKHKLRFLRNPLHWINLFPIQQWRFTVILETTTQHPSIVMELFPFLRFKDHHCTTKVSLMKWSIHLNALITCMHKDTTSLDYVHRDTVIQMV